MADDVAKGMSKGRRQSILEYTAYTQEYVSYHEMKWDTTVILHLKPTNLLLIVI